MDNSANDNPSRLDGRQFDSVTSPVANRAGKTSGRPRFFFLLSLVMLVVVFLGFAPTYYLDSHFDTAIEFRPMPLYLAIHALVLTMWFVGQVVQSGLIQARRRDMHRTFGAIGAGLAAGVVITGIVVTMNAIPHAEQFGIPRGIPLNVLVASNTVNLLLFCTLVSLALYCRSKPQYHKRYMVIASIAIIGPAVSPFRAFGKFLGALLPDSLSIPVPLVFWILLVVSIVLYDLSSSRRIHPATLWGGGMKAAATVVTISLVNSGLAALYVNWVESWI